MINTQTNTAVTPRDDESILGFHLPAKFYVVEKYPNSRHYPVFSGSGEECEQYMHSNNVTVTGAGACRIVTVQEWNELDGGERGGTT